MDFENDFQKSQHNKLRVVNFVGETERNSFPENLTPGSLKVSHYKSIADFRRRI